MKDLVPEGQGACEALDEPHAACHEQHISGVEFRVQGARSDRRSDCARKLQGSVVGAENFTCREQRPPHRHHPSSGFGLRVEG